MFPIRSYSLRTLPRLKKKFLKNTILNNSTTTNSLDTNNNSQNLKNESELLDASKSIESLSLSSPNSPNSPNAKKSTSDNLTSMNYSLTSDTDTNKTDKQKKRLEKCLLEVTKSLKYLEQVISKNKFEIIANSSTMVLECVLDIYNILVYKEELDTCSTLPRNTNTIRSTTFKFDSQPDDFTEKRIQVNRSLAELIKYSDRLILLSVNSKLTTENETLINNLKLNLIDLIKQLTEEILELISISITNLSLPQPKFDACSLENPISTSSWSDSLNRSDKHLKSSELDKKSALKSISSDNILNESASIDCSAAAQRRANSLDQLSYSDKNEPEIEEIHIEANELINKNFDNLNKLAEEISELPSNVLFSSESLCNDLIKKFQNFTENFQPEADCSPTNKLVKVEQRIGFNEHQPVITRTTTYTRIVKKSCNNSNKSASEKGSFDESSDCGGDAATSCSVPSIDTYQLKSKFNHDIEQLNTITKLICSAKNPHRKPVLITPIKTQKPAANNIILSKMIDLKKSNFITTNVYPESTQSDLNLDLNSSDDKCIGKKQHIDAYMSIFRDLIVNCSNSSPNLFCTYDTQHTKNSRLSNFHGQLIDAPNSVKEPQQPAILSIEPTAASVTVAAINIDDLFNKCKVFSSDDSLKASSNSSPMVTKSSLAIDNNSSSSPASSTHKNRFSFSSQSTNSSSFGLPALPENNSKEIATKSDYTTPPQILESSFGSESETDASYRSNVALNLLDVNNLLEYQSSDQMAASAIYHAQTSTQLTPTIPTALRGGPIDALIVLATSAEKKDFLYQEAFLTTYRTIIDPKELIMKLLYRYRLFGPNNTDRLKRKASKNSFALLVRLLDELGIELTDEIVEIFQSFISELLLSDQLQLARILRKKLINKLEKRLNANIDQLNSQNQQKIVLLPLNNMSTKRFSLLDFRSCDLAEQMTLNDLELFLKIEASEVLLWSTKQSEELSPNLTKFTEHFNNISYWTRSRILEQESSREREKLIEKFIKIMKHLRKMNNFNSYLSILSALDSGPIQRLDWPKSIIDSIAEYSQLIDPKCGFKKLREAVAEAQPPCIPHIGLILQDLTILHIANSDFLQSGNINFWKRWQQYNILERLRYCRNGQYNFKKNPKIVNYFNNFTDFICEEAQYNLSEHIKPRVRSP